MPIYAFECTACGHDFERLQRLSDADPTDCPQCPDGRIRRRLTAPQFRLAGGGWYETDFKKDGDRKRNLAGDSSAPKESGGGEAKSESKPAGGESKPSGGDSKPAAESKPAPKADPKPAAG